MASGQYLAQTLPTPDSYWEDLPKVTKMVGITLGEKEVFRDDIAEFMEKMGRVKGLKLETVVAKEEIHDESLLAFMGGPKPPKEIPETERGLEGWIAKAML